MDVYWLEQDATEVPCGDEWLSGNERTVLDRLHIPKRRADWRLGRWTAKLAIAACLRVPDGTALAAIEVRAAPSGAPAAFLDGEPAGLSLSLSHSQGVGFCAVAAPGAEVGCDVEKVEPRSPAFFADYFTREEQALASGRDSVATLLWSAKESALKAMQLGLRCDTRAVNVVPLGLAALRDGQWQRLRASFSSGRALQGWWRQSGGFVYTAVADPPSRTPIAIRKCRSEGS